MGPGVRDRSRSLRGASRGGISSWNAQQKRPQIGDIKARFDKMTSAVFLDFKGMTVEDVTKLRDEFRKAGVEYRVVKNTLVKHALKDTPYEREARRRPRRHDRHRVELRGPERRRQGRQGVPQGPAREAHRSRPASSRAQVLDAKARRGPARDDARQERAPRHAARDASSAAPAVRRAAPGSRAELRLRARGERARSG